MFNPVALSDALDNERLLFLPLRRNNDGNVLADGFLGAVPEQPFSGAIPRVDDTVEGLANNGVIRRIHNGRQMSPDGFGLLQVLNVSVRPVPAGDAPRLIQGGRRA